MTTQVDQVPVPEWAFVALGQPVERRNFHYAAMLYPDGRFKDHWHAGQSVPDVNRPETKLWFYFHRSKGGRTFSGWDCEHLPYLVEIDNSNGYLQMPGSRTLASPTNGKRWYYANRPSAAVPDGFGDEDAIRLIWASS